MIRFSALFLFSILMLVSCKDDDNESAPLMSDSLEGTWTITAYNTQINTQVMGQSAEASSSSIANSDATISFDSVGTFSTSGTFDDTTVDAGNSQTTSVTLSDRGTYSVNGQIVTLNVTGFSPYLTSGDYEVTNFSPNSRVEMMAVSRDTLDLFGVVSIFETRSTTVLER
jgi:hypothetical protein